MSGRNPDPRRHAWRTDLAAEALRDVVAAPRYAGGETRRVVAAAADLRHAPGADEPLDSQALHGETVRVYEVRDGWAWGQLEADRYVGYLPADALGAAGPAPTHRVRVLRTYVFAAPDIKRAPRMLLSMNAAVALAGEAAGFARLADDGGFVFARHLAPTRARAADFVAVAEMFLGAPYLWGGRTSIGLDCSALVQLALQAAGFACPRDSDMQAAELGEEVAGPFDPAVLRRGDLLFWRGHVGLMRDETTLLHANAHHMMVASEPLPDALARLARAGLDVQAVRRMPGLSAA